MRQRKPENYHARGHKPHKVHAGRKPSLIFMGKSIKNSILIVVAVAIVALLIFFAVTRPGKPVQPKITSVIEMKEAVPELLKPMLPADVFPAGAVVRQNQDRKISDGSEQIVFVYETEKDAAAIYAYFRKYFKDNGFYITLDSISPFVSPNKFNLIAMKGGASYNVFIFRSGESTVVTISVINKPS